jgi:hypothetical protein
MIKISSDFGSEGLENNLESFIIYLKDIAKTEDEDPDKIEFSQNNAIKIMSIHAAKGLEFEVVFLPMLWKTDYAGRSRSSKFKIPSLLRKDREIYREKVSFTSKKSFDDEIRKLNMEEERRIFYVACSRARNRLFLSYSSFKNPEELKKPGKKEKEVLPFLLDIFDGGGIKALNKKSLDFIKSANGNTSGIELFKSDVGNADRLKAVRSSRPDENMNCSRMIFNPEEAYKSEDYLVSLMKKTDKKEIQKKYKNYLNTAGKSLKASCYRPKTFFSLTELLDFIDCPLHYKWKYFYNIPEEASERTRIGEKVHDQIMSVTAMKFDSFINGGFLDSRDFRNTCSHVMVKGKEDPATRYVSNYMKSWLYRSSDLKHMFLEQLFYWNLTGFIITCKVDRMDITEDDNVRIIDYKISELKKKNPEANYVRQLKAYTAGAADIFRIAVDDIKGHLLYLGNSTERQISFNKLQIEEFSSEMKAVIKNINNLDFARKEQSCENKKCTYHMICSGGMIRL